MKKGFILILGLILAVVYWRIARESRPESMPPAVAAMPARMMSPTVRNPISEEPAPIANSAGSARALITTTLGKAHAESMPYEDQIRNHLHGVIAHANPPLNLDDREFTAFADTVLDMLKVNGLLKAESAHVSVDPDGKVDITVPARPDIAAEMRRVLNEQLAARLGQARADEIDTAVRNPLISYFWGYGFADERFQLTPRDASGNYDYLFAAQVPDPARPEVAKFVHYWGGGSESGTNASLTDLLSNPQYSFLMGLIPKHP